MLLRCWRAALFWPACWPLQPALPLWRHRLRSSARLPPLAKAMAAMRCWNVSTPPPTCRPWPKAHAVKRCCAHRCCWTGHGFHPARLTLRLAPTCSAASPRFKRHTASKPVAGWTPPPGRHCKAVPHRLHQFWWRTRCRRLTRPVRLKHCQKTPWSVQPSRRLALRACTKRWAKNFTAIPPGCAAPTLAAVLLRAMRWWCPQWRWTMPATRSCTPSAGRPTPTRSTRWKPL